MNKVAELKPFQKRVELNVKVLEKNEVREVTSKLDNSNHKVTEVLVGDDSGTILLTLWDDMIERVEVEKSYKIANGYTSLFKNSLRMNIGRYGELSDSEEEVSEINSENNVSEKEFERGPRRFGDRNRGFRGNRDRDSAEKSDSDTSASADDSQDSAEKSDDTPAEDSDSAEEESDAEEESKEEDKKEE